MTRKAQPVEYQASGVCTWCGHTHRHTCLEPITVAAGPSGAPGRATPTKIISCPCRREAS